MGAELRKGKEEMNPPRVFFDATVWISALISPSGIGGLLLFFAEQKSFVTLTTSEIQTEVSRWISRQKKQLELNNRRVSLIQRIRPTSVPFTEDDLSLWPDVPETDRHVIAGAVKGNADVLVSDNIRHIAKPSAKKAISHIFTHLQFLAWFKKLDEKTEAG